MKDDDNAYRRAKDGLTPLSGDEPPRHRKDDPPTSKDGADHIKLKVGTIRAKLVDALIAHGLLTTREMHERTGIEHASISPRMKSLVDDGYVVNSGEERVGSAGVRGILWQVTAAGRAARRM